MPPVTAAAAAAAADPPRDANDGGEGSHHLHHRGGGGGGGVVVRERYRSLVIDSGAIIKGSPLFSSSSSSSSSYSAAVSGLLECAERYYTVPGVLREVRDAESRRRLDEFRSRLLSLRDGAELEVRSPSPAALAAVADFARKTGDYARLGGVDLQVLGLLYDLEGEANDTIRCCSGR